MKNSNFLRFYVYIEIQFFAMQSISIILGS